MVLYQKLLCKLIACMVVRLLPLRILSTLFHVLKRMLKWLVVVFDKCLRLGGTENLIISTCSAMLEIISKEKGGIFMNMSPHISTHWHTHIYTPHTHTHCRPEMVKQRRVQSYMWTKSSARHLSMTSWTLKHSLVQVWHLTREWTTP